MPPASWNMRRGCLPTRRRIGPWPRRETPTVTDTPPAASWTGSAAFSPRERASHRTGRRLSVSVGVGKLPAVVKIAYCGPQAFDLRQDAEMGEPPVASTPSRADGIVDPPILLYHRVCADDEWRPSDFAVASSVFREQMRYLACGNYYTPPLSQVLAWKGRAPRTPKTPVVLTFDDGYADNLQNALPILQEFGFTAAVFPVLDLRRRFTWWGEMAAVHAPLLTPGDMRSMESAGIEFGSHSVNHPWLTRLSESELVEELSRSRDVLGSIVERPLPVLAYPYGDVDRRVKHAV